jgi:hypothetical protein
MKFILTMYICSAIAQQCSPGILKPTEYKDWNDCLQNGYSESQMILNNYTIEEINKYEILTKFTCIKKPSKGA